MRTECSEKSYNLLTNARLPERIAERVGDIERVLVRREVEELLDERTGVSGRDSLKGASPECKRDIATLVDELRKDPLAVDLTTVQLPNHPFFLASLVLEEDLKRYQEFGFASELDLAQSITAYCIGERETLTKDPRTHSWRHGHRKHTLSLMTHGDVSVSEITLDSTAMIITSSARGFTLFQDCSPLLITALHYARWLGSTTLHEISSWQLYVAEGDRRSPWGEGLRLWHTQRPRIETFSPQLFRDYSLIGESDNQTEPIISIPWRDTHLWPVVEGDSLVICRPHDDGQFSVCPWGGSGPSVRVERLVQFAPNELPELLKGIYKTYARSRVDMCEIMNSFCTFSLDR